MKLCDTCIYRNKDEYHKPCIVYRDDCEFYEREGDMTREEAIKIIKECKEKGFKHTFYTLNQYHEALEMAIKAIKSIDAIKADISMYESDCRLSDSMAECAKCNDNVFGSIYRIIDRHTKGGERMGKCRYDLSEDCNNTDCLNCVLDKIRTEIKAMFPPSVNWMYGEGYGHEHTVCEVLVDVLQIIDKCRGEKV